MQCPTCDLPLLAETICGEALERCASCGGEFSPNQTLRRLLSAHAPMPGATMGAYPRPSPLSDPMRYRKCPACGEMMLRKNFRDSSGVVVDVCSAHGIWFDRGELGTILQFATTGALANAERGIIRRAEARRSLDAFEQGLRNAGPKHYIGSHMAGPVDSFADIAMLIPDIDDD